MSEDQPDATPEEAAADAIALGTPPIEVIKQLIERFGLGLGEAKETVHRNLSSEQQVAAEALWDAADAAARLGE